MTERYEMRGGLLLFGSVRLESFTTLEALLTDEKAVGPKWELGASGKAELR
jgi:hypothetical protein